MKTIPLTDQITQVVIDDREAFNKVEQLLAASMLNVTTMHNSFFVNTAEINLFKHITNNL